VKDASLFMAKAISGRVALARYCNSPNSHANGLFRSPSDSSGLGSIGIFASKGVATGFAHSIPSFFRIASIYRCCEMEMESVVHLISILIIFEGSPRSVTCHLCAICSFVRRMPTSVLAKMSRSSTQTVMIWKSVPLHRMYAQGSEYNHVNPMACIP
jgi:hypothetical protein